jgi:resuscitation-promoting factor RpfB
MILKRYGLFASLGLILIGAATFYFGMRRSILVIVDDSSHLVETSALTTGWALQEGGISYSGDDWISPRASTWLGGTKVVYLFPAREVKIWLSGSQTPILAYTAERIPANILAERGLKLFPGDRVWSDGKALNPTLPLQNSVSDFSIQLDPAAEVTVVEGERTSTFLSADTTLGSALFKAGYQLEPADKLSIPADTPLKGPVSVIIQQAKPITIQIDQNELAARTSAELVGPALAEAGFPLQSQDYSIPDENSALPVDGIIKVVRVREEVVLNETEIPYSRETTADPETELDQTSVVQAGQTGLKVVRERVRYENGEETDRKKEAEWTAREPIAEKIGYGSKIVIRTMDTPDGPVEYYRAVSVYATSYSPCRQGMGKCSLSTASGIPLRKGIVAVRGSWYASLGLTKVYVPDYGIGTIADTGGGIPGKYWIDLGYGEEDFINWHQQVTVYFLTPVPANVVGALP